MNKMMRILKAGLVVLFLAFVIVPNEVCAQLNNTFSNPYGHNLIGDENGSFVSSNQPNSGSNKASTSSESSVQAGNMPGTEGFRDLKSNESASDIFVILQKKIYGTLVDLRQIVYVIAGFGLVMFAVAAIFNKISYKHLGYIMIGLSLLSLMFPFLEYFSGYNVEKAKQKQLTFSNFLAASDYAIIRGTLDSDLANPTGEGQPPMTEEELAARRAEAQKNAGILAGVDTSALTTGVTGPKMETKLAGQEQRDKIIKAGCSPATMKGAWNPETMTRKLCSVGGDGTILTNTETCQGKLKNGECTKTAGQIFNDIWKTGQDVVQ
ncbi:MAG TPA: hypothetical protein DIC64_04870, partial [Alphaproteobacteria bacterium]|nr:hypothetical protein [Alphaproteobacteria bacterium]